MLNSFRMYRVILLKNISTKIFKISGTGTLFNANEAKAKAKKKISSVFIPEKKQFKNRYNQMNYLNEILDYVAVVIREHDGKIFLAGVLQQHACHKGDNIAAYFVIRNAFSSAAMVIKKN
jgi:hypothetical protein